MKRIYEDYRTLGFQEGYNQAIREYNDGMIKGYKKGYEDGLADGYKDGIKVSKQSGMIIDKHGITVIKDEKINSEYIDKSKQSWYNNR